MTFTNKKDVAKSIGHVFGPYREEHGKHIMDYGPRYEYDTINALLLDWYETIKIQHIENDGTPGCNWADEIEYIEKYCK